VYLGEEYVNKPKLSDVTFLVEGGVSAVKFSPAINCLVYIHSDFDIYTNLLPFPFFR